VKRPDDEPLRDEASAFPTLFPWCRGAKLLHFDFDGGTEVAIYDAELKCDDGALWRVWILVGNLPPTIIPREDYDSLGPALETQILNFEAWADAADRGETSMGHYTPVFYRNSTREVEPSTRTAENIRAKMRMLREQVLTHL